MQLHFPFIEEIIHAHLALFLNRQLQLFVEFHFSLLLMLLAAVGSAVGLVWVVAAWLLLCWLATVAWSSHGRLSQLILIEKSRRSFVLVYHFRLSFLPGEVLFHLLDLDQVNGLYRGFDLGGVDSTNVFGGSHVSVCYQKPERAERVLLAVLGHPSCGRV